MLASFLEARAGELARQFSENASKWGVTIPTMVRDLGVSSKVTKAYVGSAQSSLVTWHGTRQVRQDVCATQPQLCCSRPPPPPPLCQSHSHPLTHSLTDSLTAHPTHVRRTRWFTNNAHRPTPGMFPNVFAGCIAVNPTARPSCSRSQKSPRSRQYQASCSSA
jgi:hypothetical protein